MSIRDAQHHSQNDAAASPRILSSKIAQLGPDAFVRRAFPTIGRRTVGPWCFCDHFGPDDVSKGGGVPPHPHIGLQTVTWLIDGEVRHRDSIGTDQIIRAGQLNVMTSGRGIAHSEDFLPSATMHGVQLWVALPPRQAEGDPGFEHHPDLPRVPVGDGLGTVLAGQFAGAESPATFYTPIVGVDLAFEEPTSVSIPLDSAFEHAFVTLTGAVSGEHEVPVGSWAYLPVGTEEWSFDAAEGTRVLMVGGEPVDPLIIWWNFVARSRDDIAMAQDDWVNHRRFGVVPGWSPQIRLEAPPVTPNLVPR